MGTGTSCCWTKSTEPTSALRMCRNIPQLPGVYKPKIEKSKYAFWRFRMALLLLCLLLNTENFVLISVTFSYTGFSYFFFFCLFWVFKHNLPQICPLTISWMYIIHTNYFLPKPSYLPHRSILSSWPTAWTRILYDHRFATLHWSLAGSPVGLS